MTQPLDGPSKQFTLTVTTGTAVEVKDGANPAFEGRQVITMQPQDGRIRVYFADEGEVPSAATVSNTGFLHYRNQKETYEAGPDQAVFIVADSGTVEVAVAERG